MSDYLPPVVARLMAETTDFAEKFGAAQGTMSETESRAGSAGSAIGAHIAAGLAVAGTAVGGVGMELTHLGDGLETARKQLEAAGKAAGMDMAQLDEITKRADSSMEKFGHTSTDTDGALQKLVQAGRPAEEMSKDMSLAADLAASKHISLGEAAGLVGKIYAGNAKVLKEFGINLKDVADPQAALTKAEQEDQKVQDSLGKVIEENRLKHMAYDAQKTHSKVATEELRLSDEKLAETQATAKASTDSLTRAQADAASGSTRAGEAIDLVTQKVKGQAAAAVDTFGGRIEVAKVKVEDFVAGIGTKIGPAMSIAGPAIGGLGMVIQSGLIPGLLAGAGSAATFAGGMIASGLSAAGAALPVILAWAPVILAIAAVGLAGYELYQHWDQVWGFVKHITSDAADWITGHLELIAVVVLAPIAPLILLYQHWDEVWGFIKDIAGEAWNWLRNTISTGVDDVVGFVASLPGRAVGALESLGGDIAGVATGAMSSMANATDRGVGDVVSFVAGLPGRAVDALGNLGGYLYSAGVDLLQGMINGLGSMASRLASAALAPVTHAVDAVKGFLHIGSPSKLFYGFGVNIGEGMELGIMAKTGDVAGAGRGLAGATVADWAGGLGGVSGGGSVLAGGGSTVVNHAPMIVVQTATGDIPDETIRKLRTQLFEMSNDVPPGQLIPVGR